MAESKNQVTKVNQLRPLQSGLTLTVKVVDTKLVMQRGRFDGPQGRQMRMAECLVGDETGMIIFTARNDQVDKMKAGATLTLNKARIDIFKGSMRLAVDTRVGSGEASKNQSRQISKSRKTTTYR